MLRKKRADPVNPPQDHCQPPQGDCTTTGKAQDDPTCLWPALRAVRVIRERLAWQSIARRTFLPG